MNLSKDTEDYIKQHYSTKDALKKGIINYSKLARKIILEKKLKKSNFSAIVVALQRFERKLKTNNNFEKNIIELLKDTSIETSTKILVCVIEKNISIQNLILLEKDIKDKKGYITIIEGVSATTLITPQIFESLVTKYFKNEIIKKRTNVVEVVLKSSEKLENTPGVVGYLYSLFADNEINILETMSCWTDTIFIIEEKDLSKTIKMLTF
ncbi:MAG: hypothetical protein ACP5N1_01440 [Candidatus Woesearchaeota archaeon]